jgi:hypothetical protein
MQPLSDSPGSVTANSVRMRAIWQLRRLQAAFRSTLLAAIYPAHEASHYIVTPTQTMTLAGLNPLANS